MPGGFELGPPRVLHLAKRNCPAPVVFNGQMKRISLVTALAATLGLALASAPASAQIVELGSTATPLVAPACPRGVSPANCFIILTRTTALQTVSDGVSFPTKVTKAGWIVAFTVGLSRLSTNASTERSYLHVLDQAYGGTPRLALTVLKPGPNHRFTVAAQTPIFHVLPYLGGLVELPLSLPPTFSQFSAIPVVPGELVALSVPTWAPVLSYNLSASKFAYRQSRGSNCKNAAPTETAQLTLGASAQYLCNYATTRVEYAATEITNQPYPKTYVHAPRQGP